MITKSNEVDDGTLDELSLLLYPFYYFRHCLSFSFHRAKCRIALDCPRRRTSTRLNLQIRGHTIFCLRVLTFVFANISCRFFVPFCSPNITREFDSCKVIIRDWYVTYFVTDNRYEIVSDEIRYEFVTKLVANCKVTFLGTNYVTLGVTIRYYSLRKVTIRYYSLLVFFSWACESNQTSDDRAQRVCLFACLFIYE